MESSVKELVQWRGALEVEHIRTVMVKLEKSWKIFCAAVGVTRIGKSGSWISQLIKEWVDHCLDRRQSLCWCVLEQLGNKVDCGWISLSEDLHSISMCRGIGHHRAFTDLVERMRLDLGELVLHVVWVHGANLVTCWRTQNLDNFNELVDPRLSREKGLSEHELCHDTTSGPHICHGLVSNSCSSAKVV